MDDKKKIDDLEHKILRGEMSEIKSRMSEGFSSIHDTITKGFQIMEAENKRQNDISNIQRIEILKKQDITNGRVKALEKVTSTIKYMQEHKKVAVLVFYSIYNILEYTTIENARELIRWIQLII